jgi:hypothetical protein
VSEDEDGDSAYNNTLNRLPGMMLRMCFHDNSINLKVPKFQDYVSSYLNEIDGKMYWTGPTRDLETSGGDASVLLCSVERFHPNQDADDTASRLLFAFQSKAIPGIVGEDGKATSMVEKYRLSYADFLHNGCIAAVHYLNPDRKKVGDSVLQLNPMKFGRKDACYYDWDVNKRLPLCGPTELLPRLNFTAKQGNDWFVDRGMNPCQFMALMWTHTSLAMAGSAFGTCPLMKLPCTTENGDQLDYFTKFLQRGSHKVASVAMINADPDDPNCVWSPSPSVGATEDWPLLAFDCAIGLDVVSRAVINDPTDASLRELRDVIEGFHEIAVPPVKVLMCALNMLGGAGDESDCDDIVVCNKGTADRCISIGTDKVPNSHLFGSYYGEDEGEVSDGYGEYEDKVNDGYSDDGSL